MAYRQSIEKALIDDWHVVAEAESLAPHIPFHTRLLGTQLIVSSAGGTANDNKICVVAAASGRPLPTSVRYGFVWTCLGDPKQEIIHIPEAEEADRHVITGGSFGVHVSGLRAVENFLDMAHFPFVHTDYLGAEPHTEVANYEVERTPERGVVATKCRFFQPIASPVADDGLMVDYEYRVYRPYTVALYKTNPLHANRKDAIVLLVQPVDEENCVAHSLLCYLKDSIDMAGVRWFMQLIFAQDKPILENQFPKRLPLDPRAETPIRADAMSISYRHWLRDTGIRYGAIPAP